MFCGFAFQHLNLRLCLNGIMHGDYEAIEDVPLGIDVLYRIERPFGELLNAVKKVANLVAVRLELKVALSNMLLGFRHERGDSLANFRDAPLLHQPAQAELGEMSLDLKSASVGVILIQHLPLDSRVRFRSLDLTAEEDLSGSIESMLKDLSNLHWEQVEVLCTQLVHL